MKKKLAVVMMAAILAALCVPQAWSQALATVKGNVKDMEGKPMPGASVEYYSQENGRKYNLKTDKSGNFFSIGVAPGVYKVTLSNNGQVITFWTGVPVRLSEAENVFNIDLQKEKARAGDQMSEEQKKQQEAVQKENLKIKGLNEKLALSKQQQDMGQFDAAVQTLAEATQMDATKDLVWFKLGDAYVAAGKHNTDKAAAKEQFAKATDAYKQAIGIKPTVGAYYNNMGEAYARMGQTQEAINAYTQAAQNDPTEAGKYYFNLGAVLTNSGKVDEANAAFDKAIAADPAKADAYYQKAVNLLGKATVDTKTGQMKAPEEVATNLNKYLELAPDGPNAQAAKDLLASLGAKVETTFGKRSTKKKP
ncbi:MAG TPA: tetratricopeptide repeat protein [Terriglobales bacterium]|nr:tetratricopeptide repeat protein [Terriglobales bacterium]